MKNIYPNELIGRAIACIFHADKSGIEDDFIERRVLIEIDGVGLIELDQEEAIRSSGETVLTSDLEIPGNAVPELSPKTRLELSSPIAAVFRPFGWEHSIGLMLENGFVLHNAFSMRDNGVTFYKPEAEVLANFCFIAGKK